MLRALVFCLAASASAYKLPVVSRRAMLARVAAVGPIAIMAPAFASYDAKDATDGTVNGKRIGVPRNLNGNDCKSHA